MHTDARRDSAVSAVSAPVIAALPAEIDLSNSAEVGAVLRQSLRPGVSLVIADLTGTLFCDSSGIRQLLLARDLAAERQAELRLVVGAGGVRRALQITGADQVLALYPTLQAALAPRSGPQAGAGGGTPLGAEPAG